MADRKVSDKSSDNSELFISVDGLKGRQSVRATFRLPSRLIELLGIVASQLGIKQKSLFDQLIEDEDVLSRVAEQAGRYTLEEKERRQKTFVLSKRSLKVLNAVARRQKISRDILVEVSIRRLLPVMTAEQEKHRKRALILQDLEVHRQQGRDLLRKADKLLGRDDRVYDMVKRIVEVCEEKVSELEVIIEKGQSMEQFEVKR